MHFPTNTIGPIIASYITHRPSEMENCPTNILGQDQCDRNGIALLRNMQRLAPLTEQMRTDDPSHQQRLEELCDTSATHPVSMELIRALQQLTPEAIAREGDALRFAKIGVISNRERHHFNRARRRAARRHDGGPGDTISRLVEHS